MVKKLEWQFDELAQAAVKAALPWISNKVVEDNAKYWSRYLQVNNITDQALADGIVRSVLNPHGLRTGPTGREEQLEAGLREAKDALDNLWAAIGDRLLAKGPLDKAYAQAVARKVWCARVQAEVLLR